VSYLGASTLCLHSLSPVDKGDEEKDVEVVYNSGQECAIVEEQTCGALADGGQLGVNALVVGTLCTSYEHDKSRQARV
jgi:hypothetical protein